MLKTVRNNYRLLLWLLPLLSLLMHARIFNTDLIGIHVWRQTQTQTVIENFYEEDLNILNPRINDKADTDRIFRMEFPLMQWLFALFYKLAGHHIIISRLLTFFIGLLSVAGMYRLGLYIFKNERAAAIAAWTFNFSPVFYYYTVNPLPDNFALMCGIWSLVYWWKYMERNRIKYISISALFLGLATLTKLPFILYGGAPLIYLISLWRKKQATHSALPVLLMYPLLLMPALTWYIYVIPGWKGNGVTSGLFDNSISWIAALDILQHNLISTLPELLLNYGSVLFFLAGLYFLYRYKKFLHPYYHMLAGTVILLLLYFVFEMNMIAKVHDYYLLPFLPFLFLPVAYGCIRLLDSKTRWLRFLSLICLLLLPVTAFLRIDSRWDTREPGFNKVYFQEKNTLRQLIPENALCITGNDDSHFITLYYLHRKGWSFDHDNLSPELLDYYISKGAAYLCTDAAIEERTGIKERIAGKIFEKENLRVYKLQ